MSSPSKDARRSDPRRSGSRRWSTANKIAAASVLVAALAAYPSYLALDQDEDTTLPTTTLPPIGHSVAFITDIIPQEEIPDSPEAVVFFRKTLSIDWRGGSVSLSRTSDGRGRLYVDDGIRISVSSGDTQNNDVIDLSDNCKKKHNYSQPIDISRYLKEGRNVLEIELISKCPPGQGSSEIRLVGSYRLLKE